MEAKFTPGKVVTEFKTKTGKNAVIRYPKWEDLHDMTDWINKLSAEDTFVPFSGEQVSIADEAGYLSSVLTDIELHKAIHLHCEVDGKFAARCEVATTSRYFARGKHLGIFSISVSQDFRGEGIGFAIASATISEAKKWLPDLKLILLDCFANNEAAIGLYKKLGFAECGRVPGMIQYKGKYVDEVKMFQLV